MDFFVFFIRVIRVIRGSIFVFFPGNPKARIIGLGTTNLTNHTNKTEELQYDCHFFVFFIRVIRLIRGSIFVFFPGNPKARIIGLGTTKSYESHE